jgi:hypothetical protein
MALVVKDPDSRVEYRFEWGDAYLTAQALVGSAWNVEPVENGGLTVVAENHDLVSASVTLAGGIIGHVYRVTNRVTLSDGQVDERSMTMRVEQR